MTPAATTPPAAGRVIARPRAKLDAIAADAVDLARQALEDVTEPDQVGEHLRVEAAGERLVNQVFACTLPGYRGWSWVATLTRAPRAKVATVAETALLPGDDALLAPAWEPWSERLRPDDVGADDLLPYREYDERLEFGYEQTDDAEADQLALWELGLGRPRVLSPEGRSDAAERWAAGDFGARTTSSRRRRGTVPATCSSCGFLAQMSGALRNEFGVCTNEWSPADGRVVHLQYGCGAHSETGKEETAGDSAAPDSVVVDELQVELDQDGGATGQDGGATAYQVEGATGQDEGAAADQVEGTAGRDEGAAADQVDVTRPADD